MAFQIIAAMDLNRGIGKKNTLPWLIKADMRHFKDLTLNGTVIMGRKTWESLPEKFRPLPKRENIVLTRKENYKFPEGVIKASSLDEALQVAREDKIYVIGGATLYKEAILHLSCNGISLTLVNGEFDCDKFFPEIPDYFFQSGASPFQKEGEIEFAFIEYERI